jgi:hypothetical protein
VLRCAALLLQVMYVTLHERQLMKSAMEMAVLTSIQHPNIVRVYACLTDLVEEAGEGGDLFRPAVKALSALLAVQLLGLSGDAS